ncbi:YajQ family cyclic di-GMP-binding protein [Nocardiopsis sp. TSRI0078]|uniref:YajQ family cyclic di-GMP-binding protein n=1 Tax=unclassified Nocardiopsis TaxID=2649073 RepID=UPI00093EBDD6|nr:YajQ family cyclic di-GMP-binding protein [Nocardiopsis sp. TSRI0078]OKI23372.1 YajQ family cyclic di-GMP-binding protein [Nocardiopsis sp. TSRI0078]
MAAESSFDVVSKLDRQEVDNALNQTGKELAQRFDFKGTGTTISWQGEDGIEIRGNSEERVNAALEVFKEKLIKRKLSLKILDSADEPKPSGKEYRLPVGLKEGITSEDAKKISKLIRDEGPKGVKAQIQGDELRVSSKKRDDLQAVQNLIKEKDFDLALQFVNYR